MLYSLLSRKIAIAYSDTNDVMAQNYSVKMNVNQQSIMVQLMANLISRL